MSYPYPQDRHRDRKEKGEQPYKDDNEAMSQTDAELRANASELAAPVNESDDERKARLDAEASERLARVTDELREQTERESEA